jgi:hypothetical protein
MPIRLSCVLYYGCDYDAILSILEEMQCRIDLGMEHHTLLDGVYSKIQQVNHGELFWWKKDNKDGDGQMTNEQTLEVTMSMESTSTT